MSNKISKTIMSLIVFVVFFGVSIFIFSDDVNAEQVKRTTCSYEYGSDSYIKLIINDSGGMIEYGIGGSFYGETFVDYYLKNENNLIIPNWGPKFDGDGFSGSEYYLNNGRKCPPGIIYVESKNDEHWAVLTDTSDSFYDDVVDYYKKNSSAFNRATTSVIRNGSKAAHVIYCAFKGCHHTDFNDDAIQAVIAYEFYDMHQQDYEVPAPTNPETVYYPAEDKVWKNPTVHTIKPLDEDDNKYSCGNGMVTGIPQRIPKFGRFLYNFLQFLVPIVLVLLGTIDLVKSVIGAKEDDIKKNQLIFVKRLASAILIFFTFAIIKLILSVVSEDSAPIIQCVDCIMRNSANCVLES